MTAADDLDLAAELIQRCLDAICGLRESTDPAQRDLLTAARMAALDTRTAIYRARKSG